MSGKGNVARARTVALVPGACAPWLGAHAASPGARASSPGARARAFEDGLALALAVLFACGLRALFERLDTGGVRWLIAPAAAFAGIVDGMRFEWEPGFGYLSRAQRFVVTKECAGLSFFTVTVTLFALAWLRRVRRPLAAVRPFVSAVALALLVTTLANGTRIAVALRLRRIDWRGTRFDFAEVHELESVAVYLAALLLVVALARSSWLRRLVRA